MLIFDKEVKAQGSEVRVRSVRQERESIAGLALAREHLLMLALHCGFYSKSMQCNCGG